MRTVVILGLLLSLAAPASAKKKTVDDGEVSLVFDDAKISVDDVKSAAFVRPDAQLIADAISGSPSMSLMTVASKASEKKWPRWATWGPAWIKEAREQLAALRKRQEELAQRKMATELEPARAFYVAELKMILGREEAMVDYLERHDVAVLKKTIGGADVATKCAAQTDKVVAAGKDASATYNALYFDWSNCALNAGGDKKYPKAAWAAFTKKYGVKTKRPNQE